VTGDRTQIARKQERSEPSVLAIILSRPCMCARSDLAVSLIAHVITQRDELRGSTNGCECLSCLLGAASREAEFRRDRLLQGTAHSLCGYHRE